MNALPIPADACDCHFHAIGDPARYPLAAERSYTPQPASEAEHAAVFGALGISRGVVVQPSIYGTDNSCLVDTLTADPAKCLRGVAVIDDATPREYLAELDRAGVRAIRFNLRMAGGVGIAQASALAARVAAFGWHIEINHDAEMLPVVAQLLQRLPSSMPVVLDHMAHVPLRDGVDGAAFQSLLRLLGSGRIWIKLAFTRISPADRPVADVTNLIRRLAQETPERCLWGSDWPHVNTQGRLPDNRTLVQVMANALETTALRRRVFSDNPAALYRFP